MGRPKSNNPKNRHIGIVTTEEKFRRFKALNLVGDRAIDVLLYHLEKPNKKLEIDKALTVQAIKDIDALIKDLEYEKLKLQTELEEINKEIGFAESGLNNDVERAVGVILQRYEMQKDVYNILDFLDMNEELLKAQAYLCGLSADKLGDIVFNEYKVEV